MGHDARLQISTFRSILAADEAPAHGSAAPLEGLNRLLEPSGYLDDTCLGEAVVQCTPMAVAELDDEPESEW